MRASKVDDAFTFMDYECRLPPFLLRLVMNCATEDHTLRDLRVLLFKYSRNICHCLYHVQVHTVDFVVFNPDVGRLLLKLNTLLDPADWCMAYGLRWLLILLLLDPLFTLLFDFVLGDFSVLLLVLMFSLCLSFSLFRALVLIFVFCKTLPRHDACPSITSHHRPRVSAGGAQVHLAPRAVDRCRRSRAEGGEALLVIQVFKSFPVAASQR